MSALRAPADMMHACNVSSLSAIVGKRSHVDYSSLHVCSNSPEGSHIGFGRRDADVSDSVGHHSTSANDNHGHLSVSALSLRRWCSKFSKYVQLTPQMFDAEGKWEYFQWKQLSFSFSINS